jgi:hypothetical protein
MQENFAIRNLNANLCKYFVSITVTCVVAQGTFVGSVSTGNKHTVPEIVGGLSDR